MKNNLFLLVSFIYLSICALAQNSTYPKGGYKNFEEFKAKHPSVPFVFKIERRTNGDIKMNGGNDYKITSDSIDKRMIKREIYAVSDGDTLFINCSLQKAQSWYANVLVEGKYLAFRGGIGPEANNNNANLGYSFGAVGGAISGAQAAMLRFLYVMNINEGHIKLLNQTYLENLLKDYPELHILYQNEQKKESEETLLRYLKLINLK